MKFILIKILHWFIQFGFNPITTFKALAGTFHYFKDYLQFKNNYSYNSPLRPNMPCLTDRYEKSGSTRTHYFHQDLHVARKIFQNSPQKHVDIGSRVDGFVAHVASYRPIEVFDIRPLDHNLPNITFTQCDLMSPPQDLYEYTDSLSCLHALEHFGLGRYGDPIDPNGHLKGLKNISSILKSGGILYLSVPIGPERIEFNANRVFSIQTILQMTQHDFTLVDFSYVDDQGNMNTVLDLEIVQKEKSFNQFFGCGIFEFKKK